MVSTKAKVEELGLGTKVHYFCVDVSRPEVVLEMAQKTQQDVGFVYCLINNAVCSYL